MCATCHLRTCQLAHDSNSAPKCSRGKATCRSVVVPHRHAGECVVMRSAAAQPWQTSCRAHLCTHPASTLSRALRHWLPSLWWPSLGIVLCPLQAC